jgi:hypothetical protein
MPWMDEIENVETGQKLIVYTVDAEEYLVSGPWKRIRADLTVQPSVRHRPGSVLAQSELRHPPQLALVEESEPVVSKGARK